MDYYLTVLFQNSLILNCLMFFKTVQGFEISTTTDTWDNAANHCSDNQLYKVKDNVLDDLDQHMSPGDALWVGARAKLTPYVSWDGCWKMNKLIAIHVKIPYNSLASCLDYCYKYKRIALQDKVCSCISDLEGRNLERTSKDKSECNNTCNGNMNDICGGADNYVSVYTRDSTKEIINSTSGQCLAVNPKNLAWKGIHCDDTTAVQGYICEISNRKQAIDIPLPWDQAFRKCIGQNGQMVFPLEKDTSLTSAFYWTSLRQSSAIHWQSKSDTEYPLCVSIMKTHTQGWMLQEEECHIKHRFICDDEVLSSFPVWAIVLIVFILLCVVAMVTLILLRRQKRNAKVRTSSFGNQFYHDVIPSVLQTSTGRQHKTAVNNNGNNKHYSNIYNTIESQDNSDSEADNKDKNNGGKDDATQQSKNGNDKHRAQASHTSGKDSKKMDTNQRTTSAYECVDVGENTYNTAGFGIDNKFTSKPNSESMVVPSNDDQYGTAGATGTHDNDDKDQGTSNAYAVFNMAAGPENEYNTTSFVPRENHSVDKIYDKLKLEEGQ